MRHYEALIVLMQIFLFRVEIAWGIKNRIKILRDYEAL